MRSKRKSRVAACDAKRMLIARGVDMKEDFHALPSSQVDIVLDVAKAAGYRKSKSAPGSKARMFFSFLQKKKGC